MRAQLNDERVEIVPYEPAHHDAHSESFHARMLHEIDERDDKRSLTFFDDEFAHAKRTDDYFARAIFAAVLIQLRTSVRGKSGRAHERTCGCTVGACDL